MGTVGQVVVDVTARTAEFKAHLGEGGEALHKFGKDAEESEGFLDKFKEGLGLGSGIEAFHTGVESLEGGLERIKQAFEQVGQIGRDALKLGTTVEDMSRLQFAADATHTDITALTTGIFHLNEEIGKAASGDQSAEKVSDALKTLGLDAKALKDQDPAKVFVEVANALKNVENPYERARLQQELLSKSGKELAPIMEHVNELMKESDAIGFTRTADQVEQVEKAEHHLAAATDAVKATFMDLANDPWADKIISEVEKAAVVIRKTLAEGLGGHNVEILDENSQLDHLHALRGELAEAKKVSDEANAGDDISKKLDAMQKLATLQKEYAERDEKLRKDQQDISGQLNPEGGVPKDAVDEAKHFADVYGHVVENLKKAKDAADQLTKSQVDATEKARAAAEAIHDALTKQREANEKSIQGELQKLKDDLEEKKFGKEALGAEKLIQKGASPEQLMQYKQDFEANEALDKHKKDVDEASKLWEKALSPLEKYQEAIKHINELKGEHAFSDKDAENTQRAAEALAKAKDDYDKSFSDVKEDKPDKEKTAALVERKFDFRLPAESNNPAKEQLDLIKMHYSQWGPWFHDIWNSIQNAPSPEVLDV